MVSYLNYRWFNVIIFLYIYNICFFFIPGSIKTRLIIGLIGFFYFLKKNIPQTSIKILAGWIICLIVALFFSIINQNIDSWFCQYLLLNCLYLFGAFFIFRFFRIREISINYVLYTILLCVLCNNLIAFCGIFLSPLQTATMALQKLNNTELLENMMSNKARAIGIGDGNFFHGGVISGIGLILTLYLGKINYISPWKSVLYFLTIFLTGIFIARTTICGLVGFLLVFWGKSQEKNVFISFLLRLFLLELLS